MKPRRLMLPLGVLLVLQLLLAWWLSGGGATPDGDSAALLAADIATVDVIEISDDRGGAVRMVRRDDGWRLPGRQDFPAASERVEALLRRLAALRPTLPVATSGPAAERFRVSEASYGRRIRLLAGEDVLAVLYLGDAAGPRRAYARLGGRSAIHPVALTARDADSSHGGWLDRAYLHRQATGLSQVRIGEMRFARAGEDWRLLDLNEGESSDTTKAASLVNRLLRLDFMDVADSGDAAAAGEPLLQAALVYDDGRVVDYRFVDPGQGGDPLLSLSDRRYVLRVGSHVLEPLLRLRRADLLIDAD